RMAKYYEGPGASEAILIDLPKRTYVPVFHVKSLPATDSPADAASGELEPSTSPIAAAAPETHVGAAQVSAPSKRGSIRVVAAAILIALAGGVLSWPMRPNH